MSHHQLYSTTVLGRSDRFDLADYTPVRLEDGTMSWVHRNLAHRIVLVTKHQNQQIKAMRRKQAGKPSYRQRQASARAAARKRTALPW